VSAEAKRPQMIVLDLKWTEDGREMRELFGPWTQGDPATEDGGLAHMMAAHRFLGAWHRVTELDPARNGATVIVVNDPEEWLPGRCPREPIPPDPAQDAAGLKPRDWPYRTGGV